MARDLVGYGEDYPRIVWPGNARIAVSLVVHFEEGAERTPLHGDEDPEAGTEGIIPEPGRRDYFVESFYEYGSRRGIWRLMEIFDRYGVKVTFFCCGRALESNHEVAREITAQGHEACGHGYRWLDAYDLSLEEEQEQIRSSIEAIERTTGERPVGWNSRGPSERTRALLIREGGFIYDSDSYGDDLPYFEEVDGGRLLTIPYTLDVTDAKFWSLPGFAGFTRPENYFDVMRGTFDRLYDEGSSHPQMMSVGIHPRISGRPSRASQIDRFIRYARGFPDVWFARRRDIAEWWLQTYGDLKVREPDSQ